MCNLQWERKVHATVAKKTSQLTIIMSLFKVEIEKAFGV